MVSTAKKPQPKARRTTTANACHVKTNAPANAKANKISTHTSRDGAGNQAPVAKLNSRQHKAVKEALQDEERATATGVNLRHPHAPKVAMLVDARPNKKIGGRYPSARKALIARYGVISDDKCYNSIGNARFIGWVRARLPSAHCTVTCLRLRDPVCRSPPVRFLTLTYAARCTCAYAVCAFGVDTCS